MMLYTKTKPNSEDKNRFENDTLPLLQCLSLLQLEGGVINVTSANQETDSSRDPQIAHAAHSTKGISDCFDEL